MDNKFTKNKTQNLLNILSQKEVLKDLDFENSQKRVYNSILQKMENTNTQNHSDTTELTPNMPLFQKIFSKPGYYKLYSLVLFLIISFLSIYGFLSLTGLNNEVNAQKLVENRIMAITGANPSKLSSGSLREFNALPSLTNEAGNSQAKIAADSVIHTQPLANIENIEIDPKSISYSCDTVENFGTDYNSLNSYPVNSTSSYRETFPLENPNMTDLPKITTFITTCNFPNGSKYITKNTDGKITYFNLNNNQFYVEFLGGKYAIKSLFEKPQELYPMANLNLEASKLQLIYLANLKVDHIADKDGKKYNVYKFGVNNFPVTISNAVKEISDTQISTDMPVIEANPNDYELIYVDQESGKLFLSEQYLNNSLESSQKIIETSSYTYEQALNNSTKYDELVSNNIEIKEIVQPSSIEIGQDIQKLFNSYTVITPNDESWYVGGYYMQPDAEQKQREAELQKKYEEYGKYFSDPDFNPILNTFKIEPAQEGGQTSPSAGSSTDSSLINQGEKLSYEEKMLASYDLTNQEKYMYVTIWNGTIEEYLSYSNYNPIHNLDVTIEKIADGEDIRLPYMDSTLTAKYYEYKTKYNIQMINPKCSDGERCPTELDFPEDNLTTKMIIVNLDGKYYIFNSANSDIDFKTLSLTKITQSQINKSIESIGKIMEFGIAPAIRK